MVHINVKKILIYFLKCISKAHKLKQLGRYTSAMVEAAQYLDADSGKKKFFFDGVRVAPNFPVQGHI